MILASVPPSAAGEMNMRSIALFFGFILGGALLSLGQATPTSFAQRGDVALTYDWVRTNAEPGDCGCFGLNGGGISASADFWSRWAVVAEITAEHTGSAPVADNSLTLSSYQAGIRYRIAEPWMKGPHALQPFAQALLGGTHSSGGVAGAADESTSFAFRIGGGIDLPVSARFAVRIVQADYYLTVARNGVNDRQNNLLLAAGIVYRWSRHH
ncbi:MAG: outer membrane beta-barrel protein [Candidatus Sulfotelmatobacter sp.]